MMRRRFFSGDSKVAFNTNNYLTIEALEDGLTVSFTNEIEYGIDGVGWSKLRYGSPTPPINTGQTISFRGELIPTDYVGIGTFTISKRCNLEGNCSSILFANNISRYCFMSLFSGCPIVSVSDNFLPATTLADYCYNYMFNGCTSLVNAPELPATTLADYCYSSMFQGCTSLVNAPELPATTLADYCYYRMFNGCTNLNYIKMLATNISAYNCLFYWVSNVASRGTFVKNSAMTSLPTGVSGIPSGWTVKNA